MNKFIITGRLCADPEIKYSQEGKPIVRFNFAVDRTFKREGEEKADFFSCIMFNKTAEMFGKCSAVKGTKLLIEGEVRNNNYTDNNGVKHYGTQVVVNSFEFCERKSSGESQDGCSPYGPIGADGFSNVPDAIDEELPFS